MAKLMANMKGVLKEYKSYKNPNRVVIAVGTAFGLVTEMASEVSICLINARDASFKFIVCVSCADSCTCGIH